MATSDEDWSCTFCTFINLSTLKACEICGKSSIVAQKSQQSTPKKGPQQQQQHLQFICNNRAKAGQPEQSTSVMFVDMEFPAGPHCIDGRRSVVSAAQSSTLAAQCKCGQTFKLKRVQSEGPNHGRFYNTCFRGKDGCNYFAWADHQAHDDKTLSIEWRRFSTSSGFTLMGYEGFSCDDVKQGGVGDCCTSFLHPTVL